jgi:hypothetical protein
MTNHLDDICFVTGRNYLYCHDNSIVDSVGISVSKIMCFHFLSLIDMNIYHPVIDLSLNSYPYTSYKGIINIINIYNCNYHQYYQVEPMFGNVKVAVSGQRSILCMVMYYLQVCTTLSSLSSSYVRRQ